MNVHNFKRVMKAISEASEEGFDMTLFHGRCGTTHCIAGWCEVLMGIPFTEGFGPSENAQRFLGISHDEADVLFYWPIWPSRFKKTYLDKPKATALARLKHFMETGE